MNRIFSSDHIFIAICYWFLRKIIGFPIRLLLIKEVRGLHNIPIKSSAVIAFNHQSFFDFLCFAAVAPRNIHFLSAEKFFDHKLWRILMIFTGQIKVKRSDHDKTEVHASVEKHVKKKKLIGIFPEGTRSPYKDEMLKAFTGVAQFALKHHIHVVPVGIKGTYDVMSKNDKWPKIRKIVTINIGRPLHFPEHFDKHSDRCITTYVTEHVIHDIEFLSEKKYKHYESEQFKKNSSN